MKLDGIYGVATLISSLWRSDDRLALRKLSSLYLPSIFINFVMKLRDGIYGVATLISSLRRSDDRLAYLIFAVLALSACQREVLTEINGKTMGTTYQVKVYSAKSIDKQLLKKEIDELLVQVNREMSTYLSESEISYFNKFDRLGTVKISDDFFKVAKYSLSLAHKTGGLYDPTIGPLVNLWGFGPNGQRKVPDAEQIAKAKALVGFHLIALNEKEKTLAKKLPGVYLDLSSSAKGFAVDKVGELLKQKNVMNYMVEIGGEIKTSGVKEGKKSWRVAIETPGADQKLAQKIIELKDMAIATSGSYRNYFNNKERSYSHTIDVRTGRPVEHFLVSVSVLSAQSCMQADALATALMVMGPKKAREFAEKEKIAAYFIIKNKDDNKLLIDQSSALTRYLTTQER